MTDLPASKLDEMEAKARAATQGPWRTCAVGDSDEGYDTVDGVEILFAEGLIADTGSSTCGETEDLANAAHIAAFDPPHALALLDMARGKLAAEAKLSALLDEHDKVNALLTGYMGLLTKARARATHAEQVRDRLVEGLRLIEGKARYGADFVDGARLREGYGYLAKYAARLLTEIKERG